MINKIIPSLGKKKFDWKVWTLHVWINQLKFVKNNNFVYHCTAIVYCPLTSWISWNILTLFHPPSPSINLLIKFNLGKKEVNATPIDFKKH